MSEINETDISKAIDIAWSTVGTVTPAGQQKLLLDYAAKLKESKPSHTAMNVGDERRGVGGGGGGRVSGGQGGRGGGRGGGGERERRGEGRGGASVNMRYGEGTHHGGGISNYRSDVISRGQYGGVAQREEYPAPTRSSDGRAYVGKIQLYMVMITTCNFMYRDMCRLSWKSYFQ